MMKKIMVSLLSLFLVMSVFVSSCLAAETWGQWTWKWGTRAAVGAAAAGAVLAIAGTAPLSVPLLCVAGGAAAGGAAVVSHCQGDKKSTSNFVIGGAACASGGIGAAAAPSVGTFVSWLGLGKGAGWSGAAASNGGLAYLGFGKIKIAKYMLGLCSGGYTAASDTPEEAGKTTLGLAAKTYLKVMSLKWLKSKK